AGFFNRFGLSMPVPPAISAPKNLMRMNATAKMSKKMSVDMADAELKLPWRMSSTTSWEMVAVGELEEPEIIITGRSYMRRASRVRNKIATISAGLTSGKVMWMKVCQRDAPSMRAAS